MKKVYISPEAEIETFSISSICTDPISQGTGGDGETIEF